MITNKKYESSTGGQTFAVFDAVKREITIFPSYYLFAAFESGKISRAEIQHDLYKSVVHEFTHALDPKLDYRNDIGARSFIDRITAKCDYAILAHLSQVCKKGISNDPDFNKILEYWNSRRMKYMREYLCKSTTNSLKRCSEELNSSGEKLTNDQKRNQLFTEYITDPVEVDAFMSMFIRELEFGLHSDSKKEADNLRLIKDWLVQPINGPRILPIIDHKGLFHIYSWRQYPEIWKKFKQRLADFLSNYSKNKSYRSSNPRVILTPPPII